LSIADFPPEKCVFEASRAGLDLGSEAGGQVGAAVHCRLAHLTRGPELESQPWSVG